MKTFSIGNNRILKLEKNDEIRILDKTTKKEAVFTPARWTSFLLCLDEIDNQLCKLTQGEDLAYQNHYGGGWYVSLTKGFQCIDLRKLYVSFGETTCKPTRTGIALRLGEWTPFQAGHRQPTQRQSENSQLHTMFLHPGTHDSTGSRLMSRVKSVSFRRLVTADDYDNSAICMYIAFGCVRSRPMSNSCLHVMTIRIII